MEIRKEINYGKHFFIFFIFINVTFQIANSQTSNTGFDSCYYMIYDAVYAKEFRKYNQAGKLNEIYGIQLLKGNWVPDYKITYTYNESMEIIEVKTDLYIDEKGEWQLAKKETAEYSRHLPVTKLIYQRLVRTYEGIIQSQQQTKTTFVYGAENYLMSEIEEKREFSGWIKTNEIKYTYRNGKIKTKDDGSTVEEYEYDNDGHITQKQQTRKREDYRDKISYTYNKKGSVTKEVNEIFDIDYIIKNHKANFWDKLAAYSSATTSQSYTNHYGNVYETRTTTSTDLSQYKAEVEKSNYSTTKKIKRWVTNKETEYGYDDQGQTISINTNYYSDPPAKSNKGDLTQSIVISNSYDGNGQLQSSITKKLTPSSTMELQKIIFFYH